MNHPRHLFQIPRRTADSREIALGGAGDQNENEIPDVCECDCGTIGDINCDLSVDPLDVQFLVAFVYQSQDARCDKPQCPVETGDVNCDGNVDPLDVQFLVAFVYQGQDARCTPCA